MATGTPHPIRAQTHLLQILGEELIGDDRLAIFAPVKTGYRCSGGDVPLPVDP